MSGRYEYARSGREKSVLLIFAEGTFEGLPFEIRLAAPWVGKGYGEISQLKATDRWQFHQQGYAILREEQQLVAADADAAASVDDDAALQRAA